MSTTRHLYAIALNTTSGDYDLIYSDDSGSTWSQIDSGMYGGLHSSLWYQGDYVYYASSSTDASTPSAHIGRHEHGTSNTYKIDVQTLLSYTGDGVTVGPIRAYDADNVYFLLHDDNESPKKTRLYHFNGSWSSPVAGDFTLLGYVETGRSNQCGMVVVSTSEIYFGTKGSRQGSFPWYYKSLAYYNGSTVAYDDTVPNATDSGVRHTVLGIDYYDGDVYFHVVEEIPIQGVTNDIIYKGNYNNWADIGHVFSRSNYYLSNYTSADGNLYIDADTGNIYVRAGDGASGSDKQYLYVYNGSSWSTNEIDATTGNGLYVAELKGVCASQVLTPYDTEISTWNGSSFSTVDPSGYSTIMSVLGMVVVIPMTPNVTNPGGTCKKFYCQIEGINELYEEYSYRGAVTHATRTVRSCLHVVGSMSYKLDPKEMVEKPGSIELLFDDIADPNDSTKSYFGKIFNDVRWRTNAHTYLAEATTPNQWVYPTDDEVECMDASQLAATGTAYLGWETISYTGKSSETLTGVTRGLYPAVDGALGAKSYPKAAENSRVLNTPVCSVPYFFSGRRIAVYIVEWDSATGAWGSGSLFWVGRVTDFNKSGTKWHVEAESILADLNEPVVRADFPTTTLAPVINNKYASGVYGITGDPRLAIKETSWSTGVGTSPETQTTEVTIPSGVYDSLEDFADAINDAISTAMSSDGLNAKHIQLKKIVFMWTIYIEAGASQDLSVEFSIRGGNKHWARAFGFHDDTFTLTTDSDGRAYKTANDAPAVGYHPVRPSNNGRRLYVRSADLMDQGDILAADGGQYQGGVLEMDGFINVNKEGTFHQQFFTSDTDADSRTYLTLAKPNANTHKNLEDGAVFWRVPYTKSPEIKQVYAAYSDSESGPFVMIMRLLVSSGSRGWNGQEDILHPFLGANFPLEIIDDESFYDADDEVKNHALGDRSLYVITGQDTFYEMIKRECQLFGFWFGWRDGKISVNRICPPAWNRYRHTIDESVILDGWLPETKRSAVEGNAYEFKINYDKQKKEFEKITYEVNLANAIQAHGKKSIKIEHPGISTPDIEDVESALVELVSDKYLFGYKKPTVSLPICHSLINNIYVGEVVLFEHDRVIDPYGSGDKGASCYAMVSNVQFNLQSKTGDIELLIDDVKNKEKPWGPAALVDSSATNAGWDSTNKRLTLIDVEYGRKTQNLLKHSEDIDQADWSKTNCTTNNDDEMIPDNGSTTSYISQDITWEYPNRFLTLAFEIDVANADCDYLHVSISDEWGTSWGSYFDISSHDNELIYCVKSDADKNAARAVSGSSTWARFWVSVRMDACFLASQTVTVKLYPSNQYTPTVSYAGDGSTIAYYVRKLQLAQSATEPSYVQTTSAAIEKSAIDIDDGVRYKANDEILLVERAPDDVSSPTVLGPFTVASDYETDGAGILTLSDAIPGWDNTLEYVVVFADYDDGIAGTQDDRSVYLADDSSQLLYNDTYPDRW